MFNPERFAIRLMVVQAVLFSMETALVHYLGQALSIVQFGAGVPQSKCVAPSIVAMRPNGEPSGTLPA